FFYSAPGGVPPPRAARGGVGVPRGGAAGPPVGLHYDPMLAKVVAHAPTRAEAVRALAHALAGARIHGLATNRELLVRSLRHPEFAEARLDTGFYERHLGSLTEGGPDATPAVIAAALADAAPAPGAPLAGRLGGWRNLRSQPQVRRYSAAGTAYEVRYRPARSGPPELVDHPGVRVLAAEREQVTLEIEGVRRMFHVKRKSNTEGAPAETYVDSVLGAHTLTPVPRFADPQDRTEPGSLLAPMPGTVVRVAEGLAPRDAVTAGQPLLWLEAMKMEHRIVSPASGTLTALHATLGHQVEFGALLAVVQEETPA
ncbi:biotin/lipoyl-containing protein, partial [Streptomyces sp. NPDC059456]|uniref:biotin/lipoyl-containing protein n=1 Tax=Streptomyces sp. NPDC059456 TaxID=3346838 RepID=UPI00368921FE